MFESKLCYTYLELAQAKSFFLWKRNFYVHVSVGTCTPLLRLCCWRCRSSRHWHPVKGWVSDTYLGVNKEHCNSKLVSDLDITHFYNDLKIRNSSGTHFWEFCWDFFYCTKHVCTSKVVHSSLTVYNCMCSPGLCILSFPSPVYSS